MLEFFLSRVRQYLHFVLCFSPVGDTFRVRARRFPGLINCTTIDFFHPWPREALVSVAHRKLDIVKLPTEELREAVAHHMAEVRPRRGAAGVGSPLPSAAAIVVCRCTELERACARCAARCRALVCDAVAMRGAPTDDARSQCVGAQVHMSVTEKSLEYQHQMRRYNYVTPKSFLELIAFYAKLLKEQRAVKRKLIDRLDVGLTTLRKTAADVAILQEELKVKMVTVSGKWRLRGDRCDRGSAVDLLNDGARALRVCDRVVPGARPVETLRL